MFQYIDTCRGEYRHDLDWMIGFIDSLLSGGWSPNWVDSARRTFIGLLYLPRVIVRIENLVE
jgi:hypothetical protein